MTSTTLNRAESAVRTREAIVAAATVLFAERGYRAVSLRDIAAAAGISHPGLLRHFESKDQLLGEVVNRQNLAVVAGIPATAPALDGMVAAAERNAALPGYVELFTGLLGLAAGSSHPSHARMVERYRETRASFGQLMGTTGRFADPDAAGSCYVAAWDGLQIISLYLPDLVSVPDAFRSRKDALEGRAASRCARVSSADVDVETDAPSGYAAGRRRREQILRAATEAFAQSGFHGASLREIAGMVGVSPSALTHHFASKEELLLAVLRRRDVRDVDDASGRLGLPAIEQLRQDATLASAHSASEAGLIELYVTVSTEATASDHPAHGYFVERYRRAIAFFGSLFAAAQVDDTLPAHLDPWFEGLWWVALWDGLQVQSLYDPDEVDVGRLLTSHLDELARPVSATAS